MRKLGCFAGNEFGSTPAQNIPLIKKAGFDSTFISWDDDTDMKAAVSSAEKCGLEIETLHAPFGGANALWDEEKIKEGDYFVELCRRCIIAAAEYGIPYVIMHTTISSVAPKVSQLGLVHINKLVVEAEKRNVKLAFENLEFVRHLSLTLDCFKSPNVGFCYDVGHENCYTPGIKYLPLFGDRLFCTHIHDNTGLAESKDVSYRDDLHKIPFDGTIDFEKICRDIKNTGYTGSLMLEINNREPYFFYKDLSAEKFYEKAYCAALKLRMLTDGN